MAKRAGTARHGPHGRNELRIVGGKWRGRRLRFPDLPGIRPSPDRVRETLFNWLAPVIEGASCLDLFAGSGALGIEAASRGAARVVLVDREPAVRAALEAHFQRLGAGPGLEAVCADAWTYLGAAGPRFDIVFLDPPFHEGWIERVCPALAASGRLATGARIYLECEAQLGEPALPAGWTLLRSGRAGCVGYHLAQALAPAQAAPAEPGGSAALRG